MPALLTTLGNKVVARYNWSDIVGLELYDHSRDPGEDTNLALDKRYAGVMDTCIKLLHGYAK